MCNPLIDSLKTRRTLHDHIAKNGSITIDIFPEDVDVRGNALASGDDEEDRREEDRIIAELDRGNLWAWCLVKVTVRYGGIVESDTLGCCSYRDEHDFREGGSYYDDMVSVCCTNIVAELMKHRETLQRAWEQANV
jgi:hypothetical protein